jgi:outer membrane protein assembly factor BamE (lipoprotein component of BamABCDE complex)
MNKRRVIAVAALASALLVLGGYVIVRDFAALEAPGVTEANFARIKKGMTFDQVVDLMGMEALSGGYGSLRWMCFQWKAEDESQVAVWCQFDWQGDSREWRVISSEWHDANESLFKKIGRWLGLW